MLASKAATPPAAPPATAPDDTAFSQLLIQKKKEAIGLPSGVML
jgi:hypothetical protein